MQLWLRVRRIKASLGIALILGAVFLLSGNVSLAIPNLLGGGQLGVPIVLLLPLGITIALAYGLACGDPFQEAISARPLQVMDLAIVVGVSVVGLVVSATVGLLAHQRLYVAAGRNALGYAGLMLIGRKLFGAQAAVVLPVAYALLAGFFGSTASRHIYPWAWPLAAATNPLSWFLALGFLVAGSVTMLRTNPPLAA